MSAVAALSLSESKSGIQITQVEITASPTGWVLLRLFMMEGEFEARMVYMQEAHYCVLWN